MIIITPYCSRDFSSINIIINLLKHIACLLQSTNNINCALFDLFILVIMVQFVVCDMCEHTTTGCLKYMTPAFLFDVCTTVNVWCSSLRYNIVCIADGVNISRKVLSPPSEHKIEAVGSSKTLIITSSLKTSFTGCHSTQTVIR